MSIKSKVELEKMKKAIAKTKSAHAEIQRQNWVGRSEIEIAEFAVERIQELAFPTIVGSGWRSTLIHARPTKKIIRKDDIVVVDLGAKADGYCADMTRTFHASGKMSTAQEEIHSLVADAQKVAIQAAIIGSSLQNIHKLVQEFFQQELLRRKILNKSEGKFCKFLFPHRTSHWIGQVVHEKSPYIDKSGNDILLREGMAFTIEPGLYFHPRLEIKNYSGIGVRIEDIVHVTQDGAVIL